MNKHSEMEIFRAEIQVACPYVAISGRKRNLQSTNTNKQKTNLNIIKGISKLRNIKDQ